MASMIAASINILWTMCKLSNNKYVGHINLRNTDEAACSTQTIAFFILKIQEWNKDKE